jgi:DNA ligase-1
MATRAKPSPRSNRPRQSHEPLRRLLDRLGYEPRRNASCALMTDYFRRTPDPERGYALAALTGGLVFQPRQAWLIRGLIAERTDPVLFALSYDYVGDLSRSGLVFASPLWGCGPPGERRFALQRERGFRRARSPHASRHRRRPQKSGKADLPRLIATWLDALDETGRWALLKLIPAPCA